ncbi:stalk domain-containing protein [Paenibacillus oryzisoli]|uniref:Copper amine oxidase-like N-terminal domain-containing protein n=1 Tax=Paenibacillus oryzisoli TaxID=1850517 RepID=A0A198ADY1_9BACL|nr:hypothetical protein [Paenibacillus oryzisoli]OAS19290.1 hypothetical protein A8708_26640 [Paenibacillus oryzisoli]
MKKKIILLVAALMIFATGVSASSLNGDFKGNPIVKLKSNGAIVDTGEVPAMIYDGNTVVPIAALRNLGASVTWDPNTYSVDVKIPILSNSDNLDMLVYKKIIKTANLYKLNQDLSQRLKDHSQTLSLYFNGNSDGYSGAYTNNDIIKALSDIIDNYNYLSNKFNESLKDLGGIDLNDLSNNIAMNYNSIENYKKANKSIMDWKNSREYRDLSGTSSNFKDYQSYSSSGFTIANQSWLSSSNGYDKYILMIINKP